MIICMNMTKNCSYFTNGLYYLLLRAKLLGAVTNVTGVLLHSS